MKRVEKKVDFNAHFSDLNPKLYRENDKNFLRIRLKNVSGKEISSITFEAKGYDYFGDTIKVGEKESFSIVIEALKLKTGEFLENDSIAIADDIRKIELKEQKVIFSDGTFEDRKEPQEIIYYVNCFESDSYKDKPELDELLEQDERFCCYPKEEQDGWICACGYLNKYENIRCVNCGHSKEETFFRCDKKAIAASRKIKQLAFEKHLQQMDRICTQRENREIRKYILRCLIVVFAIGIALWLYVKLR